MFYHFGGEKAACSRVRVPGVRGAIKHEKRRNRKENRLSTFVKISPREFGSHGKQCALSGHACWYKIWDLLELLTLACLSSLDKRVEIKLFLRLNCSWMLKVC